MMAIVQCLFVVLAYTLVSQVGTSGDWTCCNTNSVDVNLTSGTYTSTADLETFGIEIHENFTGGTIDGCDSQVVFKVTFDQPHDCTDQCKATCDRRMLSIFMRIDDDRSDYLAHVANSPTNDGDKGDSPNNHTFDSNMVLHGENLTVHPNENCRASNQFTNITASSVRINIASGYFRIRNSAGRDGALCNGKCYFDLYGQNDTQLGAQNDFVVYVGFNKVVKAGSTRTGSGVCRAHLSWDCCKD